MMHPMLVHMSNPLLQADLRGQNAIRGVQAIPALVLQSLYHRTLGETPARPDLSQHINKGSVRLHRTKIVGVLAPNHRMRLVGWPKCDRLVM